MLETDLNHRLFFREPSHFVRRHFFQTWMKLLEENWYNGRADKTTGGSGLPHKYFFFLQVIPEIQGGSANNKKIVLVCHRLSRHVLTFSLGFDCENLLRKIFFSEVWFLSVQVYRGTGGAATRQMVPFQSFKQVTKHKLTHKIKIK
jgi:hypothetical protein